MAIRLGSIAWLIFGGACCLSAWQTPAAGIFTVDKLADRVYMLSTKSEGGYNGEALGNVVFYVSGEGVVVVDDQFEKQRRGGQTVDIAKGVLTEIRKVTNEPIRYVINTHPHGDHTGGNLTFGPLAPIIGHANERKAMIAAQNGILSRSPAQIETTKAELAAAEAANDRARIALLREQLARQNMQFELAKSPDAGKAIPSITYETEMVIYVGGEEIRLYHFGPAHTDGDTLVYFTKANVAHWGDVFETESNPAIFPAGGANTRSWIAFLAQGLQVVSPTAKMVPGHGHVGSAADVAAMEQYFTKIRAGEEREIRAGKTKEEAVDDADAQFPEYKGWRPGHERFRSNIGTIYDEVKAEFAANR